MLISMSQTYWVNNYLVDPSRNQISLQKQVYAVPKKALSVLTVLAENSGQVVSHDVLMEHVWSETVVAPNTLQHSIAQLRKVLADDSKKQSVIKTHAKQGYSLVAEIKWLNRETLSPIKAGFTTKSVGLIVIVLATFWLVFMFYSAPPKKPTFSQVLPVTATDDRESYANYSVDGRYLVFHRYKNTRQHHLWAKDLQTKKELQLTSVSGYYGSHSWSEDGNHLTFVSQQAEFGNNAAEACWKLLTLDFAEALKTPQAPVVRIDCQQNRMALARWLNDGHIGVLRNEAGDSSQRLQSFNLRENAFIELYKPTMSEVYHYDFSFKKNIFAVISRTDNNHHLIEKLGANGQVLSSAQIELNQSNSAHEYYNISFHPNGESLITSTELGIFELFFDGTLRSINSLGHRNLSEPHFHSNGHKIVAIQETGDQDITQIMLDTGADYPDEHTVTIARSNVSDVAGQFQPNGSLIAFISNRSSQPQLWLYDGIDSWQLSHLDNGVQSSSFVWSTLGDKLATVSADQLMILSLNGEVKTIDTALPIDQVLQWLSPNQLLVIANHESNNKLFKLNLNPTAETGSNLLNLSPANVLWGQLNNQDELLFVNEWQEVWYLNNQQTMAAEVAVKIETLDNQLANNQLLLKNDVLYGINPQQQLWRYQLNNQHFEVIKQLPESAKYISDIKNKAALITQAFMHNKEIIEFF